jgi:hypothetical protein
MFQDEDLGTCMTNRLQFQLIFLNRLIFGQHNPAAISHHRQLLRIKSILGKVITMMFHWHTRINQGLGDRLTQAPIDEEGW